MRKVVIAFNGSHFSEGAFEFARRMNVERTILLTGIFLPQTDYAGLWSYAGPLGGTLYDRLLEEEHSEDLEKNIAHFECLCNKHQIAYSIHKNFSDFALPGLIKETRFSDLAIISCETLYSNMGNEHYEYVKELLHTAECPVIMVPEQFTYPTGNILAYDGSESAAYAIKQFTYLFPEWHSHKTLLVYTQETMQEIPDEFYIKELTARHFTALTSMVLPIQESKYFSTWISEQPASILVSGAFSKSYFARMFKKSFVADVLKEHLLPVFMAHR
ncbi:hypothetical protein SAMN05421788_102506 [Filimonas lacunae]|uniref:Universal stress protein family protein n=1 Tax=Filimonas lacunae TaxID=477680 RepID=A0A173MH98_9BACT|nr:hypothetical protein [Filimonas lacunae]BAV06860.1 hypothetical protein FLA_2880 [Filimonas lacunae]SIS98724.1 hypothetical protein SAMN05421788_102506 [Filimonas lacunae]